MQQLLQPPEHPLTLPSPLAAARALGTQALPFALAVAAASFQLVLPDCSVSVVSLFLAIKFMSLGKRDMSQEQLYQDRKDVVPIHFTTPPPPQQSHQHHHGSCGEQQQMKCFSDEVDSHRSTELNGASV